MGLFTEQEVAFLQEHRMGRLGTASRTGTPHVVPTLYRFADGVFRIGSHPLEGRGQERLYFRHLKANPQAAFVVDDLAPGHDWQPRGVSIKGRAVLHTEGGDLLGRRYGPNWVEIVPEWVSSWGVDTHSYAPAVPRKA